MDDMDLDQEMDFAYSEATPSPMTTDAVTMFSPDMQQGRPLLCTNCKSNPIQIPNLTYPMPGILTPPDTPTSPFATLMRPMFPPRASEIDEASFLPPGVESLDNDPENEEDAVDVSDRDDHSSIDLRRQHPQFDRLRRGGLKHRNKLKLRMNVGLQDAPSPKRSGHDSNQDAQEGQAEIERGSLEHRNKLKLRMNVGLQDAPSPERSWHDSNKDVREGQAEIERGCLISRNKLKLRMNVGLQDAPSPERGGHGHDSNQEAQEGQAGIERGCLTPRNKFKLRMNVGLQDDPSPERGGHGHDSNQEAQGGQAEIEEAMEAMEEESGFIVGVELPGVEEVQKDAQGETMKLYLIGCDLRKIADQFRGTPGMENGIGQEAALSLNVSTALTGCLSVTLLCLAVGEEA